LRKWPPCFAPCYARLILTVLLEFICLSFALALPAPSAKAQGQPSSSALKPELQPLFFSLATGVAQANSPVRRSPSHRALLFLLTSAAPGSPSAGTTIRPINSTPLNCGASTNPPAVSRISFTAISAVRAFSILPAGPATPSLGRATFSPILLREISAS